MHIVPGWMLQSGGEIRYFLPFEVAANGDDGDVASLRGKRERENLAVAAKR